MVWEVIIPKKRWPLPAWIEGIIIWPFIFFNGEPSSGIRFHEHIHADQIKRHGVIRWYIRYIYCCVRYGYRDNPFEIEARNRTDAFLNKESQ